MSGFGWSPHRVAGEGDAVSMQFDVDTLLRHDDGTPILMSYTGASSPLYPKGSWRNACLFETPAEPHGWLNRVQAVGFGRWAGDGAEYRVYALR